MSLTILTVIEDAPTPLRPERRASPYEGGDPEAYVAALAAAWRAKAPEVNGLVVRDPLGPASGIRSYLAKEPVGLVALTSHARSGVKRALFGSTAAGIVHVSQAPCLVVPLQR
jgi:nucleotide-binding universal stress UspA family protein